MANQAEAIFGPNEANSPVPADALGDIGFDISRQGKLAVADQDSDHLVRIHPRRRRIPQRKVCQAVGVDVLGALFQLCKRSQRFPGLLILGIVHFDQDGTVTLNDERICRIVSH